MGRLSESAAYITYLLAIGRELKYADVERVARRDYVDPLKLLKEVLALAKESGIASRALKLAEGAPKDRAVARGSLEALEASRGEETRHRHKKLIGRLERRGARRGQLKQRYVSLLSSLYRAKVPDAEKIADSLFANFKIPSRELRDAALKLSKPPMLARTATSPERMAQEEKRRRKIAWAESIIRPKAVPVAGAPKVRKVQEPHTVVLPAPKSVQAEKKPADDTLFFHRKEQEDFARGQGCGSWGDYLEKKELGKPRAFPGNKFLRRKRA